jgi:hypothetical protein
LKQFGLPAIAAAVFKNGVIIPPEKRARGGQAKIFL